VHLSLIIPAYNEAKRLPGTLEQVLTYLGRAPYSAEVIVVDDGSSDATAEVVRGYAGEDIPLNPPSKGDLPEDIPHDPPSKGDSSEGLRLVPVRLHALARNRGKGAAVRAGMGAASGAYRVFFDADASTPIEELEKLWPAFEAGADVVIGSRALPESEIQVHQAWYREHMGRVYNLILHVLGLTPFADTQCGFKGFTAAACAVVFPRQRINRFSFDAELLYIAQKHGLKIREVPVRWVNSPQSRVNPLTDSSQMFFDLLRIRLNDLRGHYT